VDPSQDYASASILFQGNPIIGVKIDFANNVTLIGSGAAQVSAALEQLGESAQQVGVILRDAFNAGAQDVAAFLQSAGFAPDQIAQSISNAFSSLSPQSIAQVLHNVGIDPDQIAHALQAAFSYLSPQNIAGYLQQVTSEIPFFGVFLTEPAYDVNTIVTALKNGLSQGPQGLATVLQNVFGQGLNQVSQTLAGIGIDPASVLQGIQSVFGNVTPDQFAQAISGAFGNLSPANVGQLLFNAGFTPTQVAGVLSNTFGQGATYVTNFFTNTLGFGLELSVGTAQNVFALNVTTWGLILRGIGYGPTSIASAFNYGLDASISDVRSFFSNFEGLADQDIAYLMQGAGYALGQIESYFSNLGDQIASWF
jgi:hypothetical protein